MVNALSRARPARHAHQPIANWLWLAASLSFSIRVDCAWAQYSMSELLFAFHSKMLKSLLIEGEKSRGKSFLLVSCAGFGGWKEKVQRARVRRRAPYKSLRSMLKYSRFVFSFAYIKSLLVHREISKLKIYLLKKSIGWRDARVMSRSSAIWFVSGIFLNSSLDTWN